MFLSRRAPIVVLAIALVAALSPVAAASAAGGLRNSTTVTITLGIDGFHGGLVSAKPSCERSRKVTLYRQHSGPDRALGSVRSGATGDWAIEASLSPGTFYAKVAATPDAKVLTSCDAGRSRAVVLD